jgi:hypothetical protein
MMNTRYLVVFLSSLLLASNAIAADNKADQYKRHDRGGPDIEKRIERLGEELQLTDEQSDELVVVLEASTAEREALREKYEAQMLPEFCALHAATMVQVRDILSAEQADQLENKLERWASEGDPRKGPRGKPRRFMQECEQLAGN